MRVHFKLLLAYLLTAHGSSKSQGKQKVKVGVHFTFSGRDSSVTQQKPQIPGARNTIYHKPFEILRVTLQETKKLPLNHFVNCFI